MIKLHRELLLISLLASTQVALAGIDLHQDNVIKGKFGSIVSFTQYPAKNKNVTAQMPVIKQLSAHDSSLVKTNITKTNNLIYASIHRIDIPDSKLEATSELFSDSRKFLTLAISKDTSYATTQTSTQYILIDKSTGLELSPTKAIKQLGFSLSNIQAQIKAWARPCINKKEDEMPEKCQDVVVGDFVYNFLNDDNGATNVSMFPAGVYVKDNRLGVSYDSGRFTQSFEFDLKTKYLVQ